MQYPLPKPTLINRMMKSQNQPTNQASQSLSTHLHNKQKPSLVLFPSLSASLLLAFHIHLHLII